jgi:hypothetical protein
MTPKAWPTTLFIANHLFVLISLTAAPKNALGLSSPSQSTTPSLTLNPSIQVWNNVLSGDTCSVLHDTACRIGLGHRVFTRSHAKSDNNHNVVERALDSILDELGDDSQYVEYWTRQEWRSIHAHADVDEYLAKRQPDHPFRYPLRGHVLYLQTGTEVRGPTCVFPGRRSGGDLLRPMEEEEEEDGIVLITVPAVPGRLLRFEGDFLHAVPRPADLWLLKHVQGAPDFQPESMWGRSVILFNTWGDEPPMEVPIDEMLDDGGSHDHSSSSKLGYCNSIRDWECMFPSQQGVKPSTEEEENTTTTDAKIWLLGDYRRRGHQMQTLKLHANEDIRRALYEESGVSTVLLRRP